MTGDSIRVLVPCYNEADRLDGPAFEWRFAAPSGPRLIRVVDFRAGASPADQRYEAWRVLDRRGRGA